MFKLKMATKIKMRNKWRRGVEGNDIKSKEIEIHDQISPYLLLENYVFTDGEKGAKKK